MSGVEAVGLVLGVIPLIISALEHYHDGKSAVSTWRGHVRVVQSLIRNLKTEHGKLYNTCETLLGGIVSPAKLEPMLNEPFGPLWQDEDAKKRIETRLDHMYNTFQDTVKDMLTIMEELKSNLGLSPEGQPERYAGGTVKRYIMRVSLVIKRSSYDEALQGLIAKNQTLETIVIGSLRLEPSRGKRSQGKYLELFRWVIRSLYKALQLGLCEACPLKHGLCLQLLTPRLSLRGEEENIVGKLDFRAILSHYDALGLKNPNPKTWDWKSVRLQVDISSKNSTGELNLPTRPSIGDASGKRVVKRVKFTTRGHLNTQVVNNGQPAPEYPMSPIPPQLMTDKLCHSLSIDVFKSKACGYATDPSAQEYGRFSVIPLDENCESSVLNFVSIWDILKAPAHWRQRSTPSLPQKLALAAAISSGIIQLHETPWLSTIMTSQMLCLSSFNDVINFDRAYISKKAPEDLCRHGSNCTVPCGSNTCIIPRPEGFTNELIWGLFVLLIEVILWRSMDDVLSEKSGAINSNASPKEIFDCTTERGFEIVRSLLSKVALVGGQEYCNSVECCLKLAFGYPNLDLGQEEMRHQVYGNIITPIEESLKSTTKTGNWAWY
ncbi:hypothetical protein F5B22DRAFT_494677 [Xylaria bambusicola]|uniref:uncharacterized protein n=1 Tax=Xylaria bambusicola TaxID=326684 RepID=UPI002008401A|nr:uncharacterized protein F5B22DRAFT_494677 [Xylaria bambusicola]KAI0505728.1 hypothetical protein F5B22DRAFT_494677 [Xylaria bambusicola]